jgi:hypothetical protein
LISKTRVAKVLTWVGRIIALSVTVGLFIFYVIGTIDAVKTEGLQQALGKSGLILVAFIVLVLVGCVVSWWWLLPAGILLISAYLFFGISSGLVAVYDYGAPFQWFDFYSMPAIVCLVSGVLFLVSWWITRKPNPSALPPSQTF